MKVWYRLPNIEGSYQNKLQGHLASYNLWDIHKLEIEPIREWMLEHDQTAKPEFKWEMLHFTYELASAVGFDLPEEYATLFNLRFG